MTATTEIAVRAAGHLTVAPDQTAWTPDQELVLRQAGVDNDVTPAELTGFLHLTQRTGLDPFSRQIYLIGRQDKRAGRKVFTPQTGIDGYRIIAQRTAERTGAPLSYDDTLWCGEDGVWSDVWLSKKPPLAAKVTVYRGASRFSAVALYGEYVQTKFGGDPTAMWARMPAVMLAKCAESLALRKAFPHDLAGVYTAEEMGQADNPRGETQGPERPAQRQSVPVEDPWYTTGPASEGIQDAEIVGETPQASAPSPLVPTADQKQLQRLAILLGKKRGLTDRDACVAAVAKMVNRPIASRSHLTKAEIRTLIATLDAEPDLVPRPPDPEPVALEDNPVRDVLLKLITDATTFAQLAEAAKDIVAELARGNLIRAEADVLRAAWKAQQGSLTELQAMRQEEAGLMAMAGAEPEA